MFKALVIAASVLALGVTGNTECKLANIHGAYLGLADITHDVSNMYNSGMREVVNSADYWGPLVEGGATMTVVYEKCGNLGVTTAKVGESVQLP